MKTIDYINTLIREKDDLKKLCNSHSETIRLLKRELGKLKIDISKKDKKIQEIENAPIVDTNMYNMQQIELENIKNELKKVKMEYADLQDMYDNVIQKKETSNVKTTRGKSELNKLKSEYNNLKIKYDEVVQKNCELMKIFDDIEKTCNSDE